MGLDKIKLPIWLSNLVGSLGPLGIFTVAFLDSSVLSFPVINDASISMSSQELRSTSETLRHGG